MLRPALRKLKGFWSTHPTVDLLFVAVILVALAVAAWRGADVDILGRIDPAEASQLYIGAAQVVGLINAFSLAALAFWKGGTGRRMVLLRKAVGPAVTSSWLFAILGSLAVAGLLAVVGILAAAGVAAWLRWPLLAGLLFVAFAGVRLGWVFTQVVRIDDEDSTDAPGDGGVYAPGVRRPNHPSPKPPAERKPHPIAAMPRHEE